MNANTEIRFAIGECSLGSVLVAQSERGVCAILLGDGPDQLTRDVQASFLRANLIGGDVEFGQLVSKWSALSRRWPRDSMWRSICAARCSSSASARRCARFRPAKTAAAIANRIGSPVSAKEVAEACAANALAVVIPCHRVVKKDGALSGYRWGVNRKRALLEKEAQA